MEETKVIANALVAGEKYVSFEVVDAERGQKQERGVMADVYGAIEAH